jgi:hypothetical protein
MENLDAEISEIRNDALIKAWSMRGGASYEDILNMSSSERELINKIIEHNLEITKNSQMPYF